MTHHQLEELEDGIHAQLRSGEAADPEYWSAVLDSMALHKVRAHYADLSIHHQCIMSAPQAKARLREIHRRLLQQQVTQLNAINNVDVPAAMGWAAEAGDGVEDRADDAPVAVDAVLEEALAVGGGVPVAGGEDAADVEGEEEDNHGQWSPAPLDLDGVAGQELVTQQEDEELLELLRAQVCLTLGVWVGNSHHKTRLPRAYA